MPHTSSFRDTNSGYWLSAHRVVGLQTRSVFLVPPEARSAAGYNCDVEADVPVVCCESQDPDPLAVWLSASFNDWHLSAACVVMSTEVENEYGFRDRWSCGIVRSKQ